MIINYLKIAVRNISRQKTTSLINILGLSIGFACSILIGLYVIYELSYDNFNENADRICRITSPDEVSTPAPLGRTLKKLYPEVEHATCFSKFGSQPVKYGNNVYYESPILGTTNECFKIFSFPFMAGDSEKALKEPNTAVITESIANKYFGKENPLFKVIQIGERDYKVEGVMKDVPKNAHFNFKILISNEGFSWYTEEVWGNNFMATYLLLNNSESQMVFESNLMDFETKYFFNGNPDHRRIYKLQPLNSIHLHSNLRFELSSNGDYNNIIIFSSVAVFMILIACINFINLSTANSLTRLKEIGMRKVIGSTRTQLIFQFLAESILITFIAFLTGILLAIIFLPTMNSIVGTEIGFHVIDIGTGIFVLTGLILFVGLLAGGFPAFYLSSFKPVNALRKTLGKTRGSSNIRNGLVAVQFTISIILMICAATVFGQLKYLKNVNLGFNQDQVLVIENRYPKIEKAQLLKQKLAKDPNIISISHSGNLPGMGNGRNYIATEKNDTILINTYICDYDFQKTLQLEMADGRFFSPEFSTDSAGIIINEEIVKLYHIKHPVGQMVYWLSSQTVSLRIIGVAKNFHFQSLHNAVEPMAMKLGIDKGWGINYISMKVNASDLGRTISHIKGVWKEINPNEPFDYTFLDEEFANLYLNEQRAGNVVLIFCLLAVIVSCTGLFGVSIFVIQRRVKEIGIRKVLGASVNSTVWDLSRSFMGWILISIIIAVPISYFLMNDWLVNFAYRISLDFWIFLLAGLAALLIGFITVGIRSYKTALTNPVDSLRYE